MDINQKILDVIKENLSATQLGLLKDHFAETERVTKLCNERGAIIERLEISMKQKDLELARLTALEKEYKDGVSKNIAESIALRKEKLELDVTIAKKELEMCQRSYGEMRDIISTVFRNPKFIHTQEHHEHHEGYQHANGWVNAHDVRKTYKTTTEQE